MHALLSMIKSTGGYTQVRPLHVNVLNIMGWHLSLMSEKLSTLKIDAWSTNSLMHFKLACQEERSDVSKQLKIFYVVLSGCDSCKSKLHKTEIPLTAYLLGVQAKFPNNVFLKHRKHYFLKKYLLQSNSQNREHLKYAWNVYCVITNHKWDLKPHKPQNNDVLHRSRNYKFMYSFGFHFVPRYTLCLDILLKD